MEIIRKYPIADHPELAPFAEPRKHDGITYADRLVEPDVLILTGVSGDELSLRAVLVGHVVGTSTSKRISRARESVRIDLEQVPALIRVGFLDEFAGLVHDEAARRIAHYDALRAMSHEIEESFA